MTIDELVAKYTEAYQGTEYDLGELLNKFAAEAVKIARADAFEEAK